MTNLTMTDLATLINHLGTCQYELERAVHALLRAGLTPAEIREYARPNSKVIADGLVEDTVINAELVNEDDLR